MSLTATNGRLLYQVCRQGLRSVNIDYKLGDRGALLVWCDTVKIEFFRGLHPWQVINRLPWGKTMCRKTPFVRLIQRIQPLFPELFAFLPKSYVLPKDIDAFEAAISVGDCRYIYKPDKGSLGRGIRVLEPGESPGVGSRLAIAQEYIESLTIDDRKFDLRVYVLVASLDPLRIYVYRNGVARFCTASADGSGIYSQLTNTAVNKKNPEAEPGTMTKTVADVFRGLQNDGHDIEALWDKIDSAIAMTIISGYGHLKSAEERDCPSVGYPRCFQIIGCDVLLDKELNPYILEINYRPSMKCNTEQSHELKLSVIQDALRIGCPYEPLQTLIRERPDVPETIEEYRKFIAQNRNVIDECERCREQNEKNSEFVKIYPSCKHPEWSEVLDAVKGLPTEEEMDGTIAISAAQRHRMFIDMVHAQHDVLTSVHE